MTWIEIKNCHPIVSKSTTTKSAAKVYILISTIRPGQFFKSIGWEKVQTQTLNTETVCQDPLVNVDKF